MLEPYTSGSIGAAKNGNSGWLGWRSIWAPPKGGEAATVPCTTTDAQLLYVILLVYGQCLFPFISELQPLGLETHCALFLLIAMELSTTDVVARLAMEQYQPQSDDPEPSRPFLAMVKAAAKSFLQRAPHDTHGAPIFEPDGESLLSLLPMKAYQGAARQLLKHKAIDLPEDNLEQWLSPDNVVAGWTICQHGYSGVRVTVARSCARAQLDSQKAAPGGSRHQCRGAFQDDGTALGS